MSYEVDADGNIIEQVPTTIPLSELRARRAFWVGEIKRLTADLTNARAERDKVVAMITAVRAKGFTVED